MLSMPPTTVPTESTERTGDQNMDSTPPPVNDASDDFEEIILYQMTLSKVSETFTAKVIQLTAVEDPIYDSGFLDTVVADTTGDVIKLRLDLGVECPASSTLKGVMKKFRFGTVWKLRNPDFIMENGDESTMYIRYQKFVFGWDGEPFKFF